MKKKRKINFKKYMMLYRDIADDQAIVLADEYAGHGESETANELSKEFGKLDEKLNLS